MLNNKMGAVRSEDMGQDGRIFQIKFPFLKGPGTGLCLKLMEKILERAFTILLNSVTEII